MADQLQQTTENQKENNRNKTRKCLRNTTPRSTLSIQTRTPRSRTWSRKKETTRQPQAEIRNTIRIDPGIAESEPVLNPEKRSRTQETLVLKPNQRDNRGTAKKKRSNLGLVKVKVGFRRVDDNRWVKNRQTQATNNRSQETSRKKTKYPRYALRRKEHRWINQQTRGRNSADRATR